MYGLAACREGYVAVSFPGENNLLCRTTLAQHTFRNVVNRGPIYGRVVPFYSSVGPIEHNMW